METIEKNTNLVGKRVRLIEMGSDPRPISPGELGTIDSIDDIGTIHVNWDSGRRLGLIPGEDMFEIKLEES